MKKFLLSFVLVFCFSISTKADELQSCGENCTYTIENGILTVSPIDSSQPASIGSYIWCESVNCYNDAPWYGKDVSKVVVSEGISSIGNGAFYRMNSVTSIELPEGLKTVGDSAFERTSITNIDLPSTLTSLGTYAFAYTQLENINGIPEGITELPFRSFCNTKIENFVVPSNVTTISPDIFGGDDEAHSTALITNIYCEKSVADQCARAVEWKNGMVNVISYQAGADGKIFYNNQWYNSANDILSGNHIKKRIYTIEEAERLSKKTGNTFKLRYK